jgi:hypothetical protein
LFCLLVEILDLRQEPRVDRRQAVNFIKAHADAHGVSDVPDPFRACLAERHFDFFAVGRPLVEAVDADLQAAQGFLQRLLKGAPDGHHFADRFHLRGQARVGLGNFSKAKRGTLVTT